MIVHDINVSGPEEVASLAPLDDKVDLEHVDPEEEGLSGAEVLVAHLHRLLKRGRPVVGLPRIQDLIE